MSKIYVSAFLALIILSGTATGAEDLEHPLPDVKMQKKLPELGFVKGNYYLILSGGAALSPPEGSFIRHEQIYDDTLNLQIILGQVRNIEPLSSAPPLVKSSQYESGGIFGFSFEYALFNHFGIGASIMATEVWSSRPHTIQDPRDGKYYLLPFGQHEELQLSLGAAVLDFNYHLLNAKKFDPFLTVHGGPAFAHGIGHNSYIMDLYRQNNQIHNGRGFAYGASMGFNFYFNNEAGIRPEVKYLRYDFHSDEFSNRSYYNTFLSVGFFMVGI